MARSLKTGFVFSSTHDPIELSMPIWKMAKDRPAEYEEIINQLQICSEDFKKLIAAQEANSLVKGESRIEPSIFMANCCSANISFGWLLQMCLNHIPFNSDVVSLLRDLQDSFSPLKLSNSSDNEDHVIKGELGSSFELKVKATGVPSPRYCWFKAPLEGGEWCPLQTVPGPDDTLRIQDFEPGDAGIYKCYVSHRYPVSTPNGMAAGTFAPAFEVVIATGSIWIKEIKPDSARLPIGTPEAIIGCEVLSEMQLKFQWFHNDERLAGQDEQCLRLNCLTLEMEGDYICKVSNRYQEKISQVVRLEVYVPDPKDLQRGDLKFENEEIKIVRHPFYDQSRKAAVGDKISLSCVAVCKYPLVYEWLKQGLRKDLIADRQPWDQFLCVTPVSIGPQLVDVATDVPAPISGWIYQCIITCPQTGERVKSAEVRVPVSTYSVHERSLPLFKLALVICQEQYECAEYFHPLRAPRNDGQAFIKALQEMNFCVIAFANLSLSEVRDAVDLFCSLVDENCFALFYYNGHALGYGSDIYLVARDTNISSDMVLHDQLIWHGEIESRLDACNPLLCIAIYDSCRDNPPEVIADIVKETKHEPIPLHSSFCVGYGTRPSMRNFEKLDKTGVPQGLYMKNLLKHIRCPDLTVGAVFEHLFSSFTMEEDSSVVDRMKPEYKCSTKQLFYLGAPLRRSTVGHNYLRYFKLFRFEAAQDGQQSFDIHFSYRIGICWDGANLHWVTNDDATIPAICENFIQFRVEPAQFNNEALLHVNYAQPTTNLNNLSDEDKPCDFPYGDVSLQIISVNARIIKGGTVYLEGAHHDVKTFFPPCSKKSGFVESDGPVFPLKAPVGQKDLIGRCGLVDLQRVEAGPLKFRTVLTYKNRSIVCRGVMAFPVPIVKNFPKMKIKNLQLCKS